MRRDRGLHCAPALVEPQIGRQVRHVLPALRGERAGAEAVGVDDVQEPGGADGVDHRLAARGALLRRHGGREPNAEVGRVGEHVDARAAGVAADDVGLVRVQAEAVDVEERHGAAGGEPGELQERAVDIRDRVAAGVDAVAGRPLDAGARIGAQRAILRLRAGIERPQDAGALDQLRGFAIVDEIPVAARHDRPDGGRERAARVRVRLGAQVAAELQARIGAGDVVEAGTVDRADLHVFDRLRLDRKVGGARRPDRDDTRRAREKKRLRPRHLILQIVPCEKRRFVGRFAPLAKLASALHPHPRTISRTSRKPERMRARGRITKIRSRLVGSVTEV